MVDPGTILLIVQREATDENPKRQDRFPFLPTTTGAKCEICHIALF
jgi:hypothetical protein